MNHDLRDHFAGGEHAGEQGTVKITLGAVKERELPEADDDFAQLASEFDTIAELREDLREQAGKRKETDQGVQARDKVLEHLIETLEVPVPAKVVADEVERHLESEDRVDDDEHRKEVTEETERNLRTQFILDAVSEAENVEVSQPELIEYLISASQQYGMNPNESPRCSTAPDRSTPWSERSAPQGPGSRPRRCHREGHRRQHHQHGGLHLRRRRRRRSRG